MLCNWRNQARKCFNVPFRFFVTASGGGVKKDWFHHISCSNSILKSASIVGVLSKCVLVLCDVFLIFFDLYTFSSISIGWCSPLTVVLCVSRRHYHSNQHLSRQPANAMWYDHSIKFKNRCRVKEELKHLCPWVAQSRSRCALKRLGGARGSKTRFHCDRWSLYLWQSQPYGCTTSIDDRWVGVMTQHDKHTTKLWRDNIQYKSTRIFVDSTNLGALNIEVQSPTLKNINKQLQYWSKSPISIFSIPDSGDFYDNVQSAV